MKKKRGISYLSSLHNAYSMIIKYLVQHLTIIVLSHSIYDNNDIANCNSDNHNNMLLYRSNRLSEDGYIVIVTMYYYTVKI